ncbi:UL16-binding protein 1 isoform X2 [Mesocricetus auratus]|uniref:UL16-binding protein 1 isoform X2 n=1 Tax=Mesocricetus auratus TaxID=10036 RepID=A0ABM2YHF9_MESAU|nr:UL16-binding protein 1 isoform X2 [Mesocricetus auratus]
MKWVTGSKVLLWLLALVMLASVLQEDECAPPASDDAALCYGFNVDKSGSGPWQHTVQGQLNGEAFIYCDSNYNCRAIGLLGNRLMDTMAWKPQADALKDGIDLFKAEMTHMTNNIREPLSLQAKMCCWHEGDGHFKASWDIGLNGHKMLHFDSSTGKLTKAEKGFASRDVTDFFYMTSRGDCRSWLEEFKSHREEKLEPIASPNGVKVVNQQNLSLAIKPSISGLLIILTCSLLLLN